MGLWSDLFSLLQASSEEQEAEIGRKQSSLIIWQSKRCWENSELRTASPI